MLEDFTEMRRVVDSGGVYRDEVVVDAGGVYRDEWVVDAGGFYRDEGGCTCWRSLQR